MRHGQHHAIPLIKKSTLLRAGGTFPIIQKHWLVWLNFSFSLTVIDCKVGKVVFSRKLVKPEVRVRFWSSVRIGLRPSLTVQRKRSRTSDWLIWLMFSCSFFRFTHLTVERKRLLSMKLLPKPGNLAHLSFRDRARMTNNETSRGGGGSEGSQLQL